jgi:hypothetical protein
MEISLKKSCLGSLYLANVEAIQTTCKFKVAEASEWIFELAENTWAVYSTGTINMNQFTRPRTRSRLAKSTREIRLQWNLVATSGPWIM